MIVLTLSHRLILITLSEQTRELSSKLCKRFDLDLMNARASYIFDLAASFERVLVEVAKPEPHRDDLTMSRAELRERPRQQLAELAPLDLRVEIAIAVVERRPPGEPSQRVASDRLKLWRELGPAARSSTRDASHRGRIEHIILTTVDTQPRSDEQLAPLRVVFVVSAQTVAAISPGPRLLLSATD
jgi:hypothetical protein